VNAVGRVLLLLGAAGTAICAVLPWVTLKGLTFAIDLGVIGASVTPVAQTVSGTETPIWPILVAVAVVVIVVGLLGIARRLLAAIGVLVVVAGSALLYYVSNVIEIETRASSALEQKLADLVLTSSAGPGPPLLIARCCSRSIAAMIPTAARRASRSDVTAGPASASRCAPGTGPRAHQSASAPEGRPATKARPGPETIAPPNRVRSIRRG